MDYSARWYSPVNGRFTTQDTWTGDSFVPQTLNRYAYALNNPINITDPTGHIPCMQADNGELYCSWNPPDDWGTPSGPGNGGGGGGYTPIPDPWQDYEPVPEVPEPPTLQELWAEAVRAFNEAAGEVGAEISPYIRNGGDYAQGFTCALGKNVSYNLVGGVCQDDLKSGNKAYYWGKTSGDVITMIGGGSLAIGSGAADVGLVFTGVGTVAVPAVTGAMIQGGVVAGVSFHNLKQDAQFLFAKESSSRGQTVSRGTSQSENTYKRPSGYRKGVRDTAWDKSKGTDGEVRDPLSGKVMIKDEPWDMGHKPGYEFRKHKKSAEERGISRKEFLDEYNNPDHYRPELPSSNRSHKGENLTDDYFGD